MIVYESALAQVVEQAKRTPLQELPLDLALGRVLAQNIIAPFSLPRFDNSAVDGYAIGRSDENVMSGSVWHVARTIGAGEAPGASLTASECVRIFTGAPVPPDTYAVLMQEDVQAIGSRVQLCGQLISGQNVRLAGEELPAGAVVLEAGLPLNSAGLAAAATVGLTHVSVWSPPRVAIVVTGSEIVPPGSELGEGQIYESNSVAVIAALQRLGIAPNLVKLVDDDPDRTLAALSKALDQCDVLITTGGVSVGDRDVVKAAFEDLGVEKIFWGVAIKPGKPVFFGTKARPGSGNQAVFGLPGNPMSVLATFVLLVQPYMKACMGFPKPKPIRTQARLTAAIRHKPGRMEFVPGQMQVQPDGLDVEPILGQGSHMLGGLARADSLIEVPADSLELVAGQAVWMVPFGQVNV